MTDPADAQALRTERDRVRAEAAAEIAQTQRELREAARRAAERERELEALKARLERKLGGGRFSLRRARRAEPDGSPEPGPLQRALAERERALAEREDMLSARERELAERERRLARRAQPGPAPPQAPPRARPARVTPASTFADGLRALGGRERPVGAADGDAGSW